jgi:hypothetical protein
MLRSHYPKEFSSEHDYFVNGIMAYLLKDGSQPLNQSGLEQRSLAYVVNHSVCTRNVRGSNLRRATEIWNVL